jgi:hypothetical protein
MSFACDAVVVAITLGVRLRPRDLRQLAAPKTTWSAPKKG